MKVYRNIYLAVFFFLFSIIVFLGALYNFELSKVSNDATLKTITIEKGSISSIAKILKENDLIKSEFFFKLYIKMTGKNKLIAATYELSPNMGTKKIVDILSSKDGANSNLLNITFKEGINIRKIASIIEEETNNTSEDVYKLLADKDYLSNLISKYWFITDEVLDDRLYYPLEGYLYPNTYSFDSKDVKVETIFKSMLNETEKQLNKYKNDIENSSLSVHELLTMASMVELEAVKEEDRKGVASVFYNRLDSKMTLGSDVTTYYGAKVDMGTKIDMSTCNDYNTRCASFIGLPVGPICNPDIKSINAVLNPNNTKYYYFVADKNGDVYFSKTSNEQSNVIYKLKKQGLWLE